MAERSLLSDIMPNLRETPTPEQVPQLQELGRKLMAEGVSYTAFDQPGLSDEIMRHDREAVIARQKSQQRAQKTGRTISRVLRRNNTPLTDDIWLR